jgi:hypothetical protein
MSSLIYNSAARYRNSSQRKKITEATATKWLQSRIYFGVGPRYLGWSEQESEPRFWRTPSQEDRYKWNPILEHLKGCFRGLVWAGSTHVSFITVDLDRHSGETLTNPHILEVIATGRLLSRYSSNALGYRLNWCPEVNPRNGSVKFFGWGDQPIPIEIAQKIGEQIHEAMRQKGILGPKDCREVFPCNHPQVMLPMRSDKLTIIDSGVLPKCTRKQREYVYDDEAVPFIDKREFTKIEMVYLDEERAKFTLVPYETYSVMSFWQWLRRGGHYSESTLLETLKQACANLPDEINIGNSSVDVPDQEEPQPEADKSKRVPKYTGDNNPNSFERQRDALLVFCRQMKRVVSQGEALHYIKANRLYSGSWEQNLARRRSRVRWILKRIAKTFDAGKCHGVRHDVQVGKFDQWARHHVGTIKGRDRRTMDEFGNVIIKENRYQVDWQFISAFLSVVEYCLVTSPNDDGSLPHVRAKDVWNRCYQGARIVVPFCDRKWAICRDWLEKQGVLDVVDRNWHRGKAMRWKVGHNFHQLPQWWKRRKKPSLLEAVPLEEFLRGRRATTGLNTYSLHEVGKLVDRATFSPFSIRPPP